MWNLKIINFKHNYKPGLALELNLSPRERVKNKSKANEADDTVIYFTEVRFLQTYSPLRWSQGPPQLGVSCFDYKLLENKNRGRRKAIQATRTQMNTIVSLSQATKSLE
jgi:hypothetical protein